MVQNNHESTKGRNVTEIGFPRHRSYFWLINDKLSTIVNIRNIWNKIFHRRQMEISFGTPKKKFRTFKLCWCL